MEKRKMKWGWLIAGGVVLLLVVLMVSSSQARKNAPLAVEAMALQPGRVTATISASGYIEAADFVELRTTTNGLVDKVLVKAGDTVRAGQSLVSLDSRAARSQYDQAVASVDLAQAQMNQLMARSSSSKSNVTLQLEQAQAGLDSARSRLKELERGPSQSVLTQSESAYKQAKLAREEAEKDYARMRDLYAQGAIPKAQLEASESKLASARSQEEVTRQQFESVKAGPTDAELTAARSQVTQAETALELAQIGSNSRKDDESAAQARLRQAKAQYDAAKEALDSSLIKAPLDGKVLSVPAQSGASAVAGQIMVTVGRPGGLVARVSVDEVDVIRLRNGMPASINTDASAEPFLGQVTFVAPQGVSSASQSGQSSSNSGATFEVEVAVQTGFDLLRPGMTVDVEIEVASKDAAALVPIQAVIEEERGGERGRFVYLVKNGKAFRTPVELGLSNESMAEVVSGVGPRDMVVTGDYEAFKKLTDGATVTVKGQEGKKGSFRPGQRPGGGAIGGRRGRP